MRTRPVECTPLIPLGFGQKGCLHTTRHGPRGGCWRCGGAAWGSPSSLFPRGVLLWGNTNPARRGGRALCARVEKLGTGRPRTTLGERRYRACEVPVRDVSGDGSSEARRRVVSAGAGDTRLPGLRFPG